LRKWRKWRKWQQTLNARRLCYLRAGADDALERACRTTADAARSAMLQKDAFLVFRALCKLSVRTGDSPQDAAAVRCVRGGAGRAWRQRAAAERRVAGVPRAVKLVVRTGGSPHDAAAVRC
jgi:hypothetical protein